MFQVVGNDITCYKDEYVVLDILNIEEKENRKIFFVTDNERVEIKNMELILQPSEAGTFCYYIEVIDYDLISNIVIKGRIEVVSICQT